MKTNQTAPNNNINSIANSNYWAKRLANAEKRIDLISAHSHIINNSPGFSFLPISVSKFTADKLVEIVNDNNTNLEVILLTAFQIFLYRHTNQNEVVIGLLNDHSGINTKNETTILPIVTLAQNKYGFIEMLQTVKSTVDEANEHATEINTWKSKLSSAEVNSHNFFHQVLFQFHNPFLHLSKSEEDVATNLLSSLQNKITELCLSLQVTPGGIEGKLYYNHTIFDSETIQNFTDRYQVLLEDISNHPTKKIASLDLLSKAELQKVLIDWNETQSDYPRDKCLHQLFEEQANLTPDEVAVEMYANNNNSFVKLKQLSFAELNTKANQVAHYLQTLGVGPESVVGIYMNRSLEMAIALLGILKSGAAYLPLDPSYPRERIEYILNDSGIKVLFSQYRILTKLPAFNGRVICLDAEWNTIAQCKETTPATPVTPQNICYIIYTSGSTGMPKGTLILHNGVVNYLHWCIKEYRVKEGSGSPINSSLAFDATVTSFLSPLLAGKKVVLLPEEGEIEALVDTLQQNSNFSLIKITPAHLEILGNLLNTEATGKQANALVIGGEALTGKSLGFWRKNFPSTRLINEYGPTETVVGCCTYEIPLDKTLAGEISIGRPIANTQIYILDDSLQPVPIGVPGEIYIGGEGLARGYLNRPELTAERFIANPFDTSKSARLYKTGDIARYLNDGNLLFLGRRDKQIKIRGYRIELGEIEYAIQQSGQVAQALVIGKTQKNEDTSLVAYFVPNEEQVRNKEKQLQSKWVANWKEIYETEYGQTEEDISVDAEFNLVGWNDSFTGGPIPAEQMKQWLDDIVETVLVDEPKNVLEIGCGTGLIYYQLAGKLNKYIGFDLSESSITQIKNQISKGQRNYGQTELFTAPAHLVTLPPGQNVDTILLNSMVQYFPGEDYMNQVMDRCINMIGDEGRIIIGDVRDVRLLKDFKAQLMLQKVDGNLPVKQFVTALDQDVLKEEELCLSPEYFYRLKKHYPQISHIKIEWKKGDYTNELSVYRFTAVLYIGNTKSLATVDWLNWDDVTDFEQHLINSSPKTIAITDVPNPRLWEQKLLQEGLDSSSFQNVGDLKQSTKNKPQEAENVELLIKNASENGYTTRYFLHQDPLKINLIFEKNVSQQFIQIPWEDEIKNNNSISNIPLFTDVMLLMQKDIRNHLLNNLPKYMVPADFVAIGAIPLTSNGKVDYSALPTPGTLRVDNTKTYVAGRNKLEIDLATLFGNALGIKAMGIRDDFFELGLNSMQAYRVFAQIKKLTGKQLPLSTLIEAPTIEKLAIFLKGKQSGLPWSSLVAIQPKGSKPPLYLIHAGAGTVLFYRELALHLGEDQPVYGLQPVGLDGKKTFHTSVEEMATHYVKEILAVNPNGPYLLGGYCFGAVLAFEMAQQLASDGRKVSLLANFNGVSPIYNEEIDSDTTYKDEINGTLEQGSIKIEKKIPVVSNSPKSPRDKLIGGLKKVRRTVLFVWRPALYARYINLLVNSYRYFQKFGIRAPENLRKYYFLLSNTKMVEAYKPKKYQGLLVIFRSPNIYPDPHLGWSNFIDGTIVTADIMGQHIDRRQIMNEPFVQYTAKELKKYLQEAEER